MGILFQKSCFQVPDEIFKAIHPDRITKSKKQQLQGRRRKQFNGLVDEARVWMYAIMLPTKIIANGDKRIKRNLDKEIAKLTTKLLGSRINHRKVEMVCHKIAQNILISGTTNLELGLSNSEHYPDLPPLVPDYLLTDILKDRYIKAGYLNIIYQECENFEQNHPDARTWSEIRQVADAYKIEGKPLKEYLRMWQDRMTRIEYGMPHLQSWTDKTRKDVWTRIRSTDPSRIINFHQVQRDLILACAGGIQAGPHALAQINPEDNVLVLHQAFYDRPTPDSLRDIPMTDGKDQLHKADTGVTALLHELTHSKDVLFTKDHDFEYYPSPQSQAIDCIFPSYLYSSPKGRPHHLAYGLESCLALARRDEIHNLNKAEDNADSWALYFTLRMLMLAYPELDIVAALEGTNLYYTPPRIVRWGDELLHHCTLFQALRHPDCDEFPKRTLDYDESKDWCKQPRNWNAPATVKDLLTVLQIMYKPEQ